jgi:hypothetical protein
MAAQDFSQLKNWISLLTSCSIDYMRATKESLENEHDEQERQQRNEEKQQNNKIEMDQKVASSSSNDKNSS